MKVLVTGGAGFIGSHTVRRLLQKKYEVVVYDNLVYGHEYAVPKEVNFVKGDLADKDLLEKTFEKNKFDAVMHFAAYAYVGESVEKPAKYFENNVINGINLLNVCVKYGVKRFIFSSSCAVYGTPNTLPITENEKKEPTSPYGETKLIIHMFTLQAKPLCPFTINAHKAFTAYTLAVSYTMHTHHTSLFFFHFKTIRSTCSKKLITIM